MCLIARKTFREREREISHEYRLEEGQLEGEGSLSEMNTAVYHQDNQDYPPPRTPEAKVTLVAAIVVVFAHPGAASVRRVYTRRKRNMSRRRMNGKKKLVLHYKYSSKQDAESELRLFIGKRSFTSFSFSYCPLMRKS